jgi:hypothetical protein
MSMMIPMISKNLTIGISMKSIKTITFEIEIGSIDNKTIVYLGQNERHRLRHHRTIIRRHFNAVVQRICIEIFVNRFLLNHNNNNSSPPITNQQRTTTTTTTTNRGQFYQTQFVKPEPTRKATIPFLQPAFAPNASTQYPRDRPLPRLKPGTVRTRGKTFVFDRITKISSICFFSSSILEDGLEVELGKFEFSHRSFKTFFSRTF